MLPVEYMFYILAQRHFTTQVRKPLVKPDQETFIP
jgi:hypothetical protein